MTSDENGLVQRLGRWLRCIDKGSVRWGDVATGTSDRRTRHGVVLELRVDATMSLEDEDDEFEHLLQLREAIDLVRLTLAVEPAVLAQVYDVKARSFSHYDGDYEGSIKSDKEAVAALARGVPAELRLRVKFNSMKTRMLATQLAAYFMKRMSQNLSTNANYLAIRNELVAQIHDHDALATPVPIKLCVDSTEIEDFSLLEAEDFFIGLAALAQELSGDTSYQENAKWTQATRHTPLTVSKVELSLHRFCITHRVVRAAQAFMNAEVTVDCKMLNLDVRLISCAEDELLAFVTAITRGATRLVIYTGVDPNEEDIEPVDLEGQDRRESVEMILRVVASVEHVDTVNLGGLLALCCEPLNREVILRSIVERFLSRPKALNSLSLGDELMYEEEDVVHLERIATEFRAAHPGVKLHVKRLGVMFMNLASGRDLTRILSTFDDVEEVVVGANPSALPISPEPHAILRFPSLRRVQLHKVCIPTMDVFDPTIADRELPQKPALESLELDSVEFRDTASVGRFMKTLHPSSDSVLATSLRALDVSPMYGNRLENQVFFDHEGILAVEDVLNANRVLSKLRIFIDPGDNAVLTDSARLGKQHVHAVPAPLAARRTNLVKARNMAFLSVIRDGAGDTQSARSGLDARVVSLIFEMSAPCELRRLHLDYIEDADEDDD